VDYKSTGAPPADGQRAEYQKQVKEYAEIVSAVYPDRQIKAYIVFLDTLKTEAVKIN
jgi:ATP-dependent exoDNAse (exonuclease V) beta subunit